MVQFLCIGLYGPFTNLPLDCKVKNPSRLYDFNLKERLMITITTSKLQRNNFSSEWMLLWNKSQTWVVGYRYLIERQKRAHSPCQASEFWVILTYEQFDAFQINKNIVRYWQIIYIIEKIIASLKLLVSFCSQIWFWTYCWWTKSCTTKDDDDPIIYRVLTIPGGCLGFLPSTVSNMF